MTGQHPGPAIRRLTGTLGAELAGLSLADPGPGTAEAVRAAVLAHRVVVLREQFLEPERQIDFGLELGPVMTIRGLKQNLPWPELFGITNQGKESGATGFWHTDGVSMERPPSFSILAAHVLPEAGGDTLFADMGHAYATLSPAWRRLLRGLRGVHQPQLLAADNPEAMLHPLVRTIPETGERVLYPGVPHIVAGIDGLTGAESRPLLDFLFAHATLPERVYRHQWRPGDVLVWDNRTTMHLAVRDYGQARRELVRMMIAGERPFEAPYTGGEDPPLS